MAKIVLHRVYSADAPKGVRLLTDRLWPRGVTKERANLDAWLKEVAPTTELRKWFNHEVDKWSDLKRKYKKELDANTSEDMQRLKEWCKGEETIVLLFGAKDEKHNQAVVLKEWLEENESI